MVAPAHEIFVKQLTEALKDQGREALGSAPYLAKICGVERESARKWLQGMSLPTLDHVIQIAEKLGVCVEWLLTGRGPKKPPSPQTVAHMNTFDQLVPDKQVTIQEVAIAFAQSAQLIPWVEGVTPNRRKGGREAR